jgi:hypothetical protein
VHGRLGHKSIGKVEQGDEGHKDAKGLHSGKEVCVVWTGATCLIRRVYIEKKED